jgi:uncharacterized DUF497 family protein
MMTLIISGFDWDKGNREKCQKHGVSLEEIEEVFTNGPRVAPDLKHSSHEDRLIAVGRTQEGRSVFVAFAIRTRRGRHFVRPVSARYMHSKEIRSYEKENP